MTVDLIRYDLVLQDAARWAVRQILSRAAREGLPGDHHFCISFRTDRRGVRLSSRMRELYPEEMTIVLQHQYWDLSVAEDSFEVGLSFRNVPEMLRIPFDAVTRLFDPYLDFELKILVEDEATETGTAKTQSARPQMVPMDGLESPSSAPPPPEAETAKQKDEASEAGASVGAAAAVAAQAGPKVVSIDAFRKKS
jgi:hypothetical protein